MDLLAAAALEGAVRDREIEELRPVKNPLDVLAQIILALCVEKRRNIDELYGLLRGFYVFRDLDRASCEGVIRMLAGQGRGGRLRDLKARLYLDGVTGEITAAGGSLLLLYSSGGVIANRGMYSLRLAGDGGTQGTKIGELDEEFVWERRVGDCFDFGSRGWRIVSIGPEAVEAAPLEKPVNYIPFWKAGAVFRSPVLSKRIMALLDRYRAGEEGTFESWPALKKFLDAQQRVHTSQHICSIQHDVPTNCLICCRCFNFYRSTSIANWRTFVYYVRCNEKVQETKSWIRTETISKHMYTELVGLTTHIPILQVQKNAPLAYGRLTLEDVLEKRTVSLHLASVQEPKMSGSSFGKKNCTYEDNDIRFRILHFSQHLETDHKLRLQILTK
jgi:hypothetical protein